MTTFTDAWRAEAERLFAAMIITDQKRIDAAARRILRIKPTLLEVSARTGVPWPWIGAILERESGCRIDRHLHNGDPLAARTVNVPKGRLPAPAAPPFDFVDSAFDALCVLKGLHKVADWPIGRQVYEAERYNGFGYRDRGLRSPYVWGGTNLQQPGKYVRDGVFDRGVMDSQPGVMPLIKRVCELDAKSTTPTPELPAPQHLEAAARQSDARAKNAAGGATAAGTGGLSAGSVEAARQAGDAFPADAIAAFDWTALGLTLGAVVLIGLAVWLGWRAGLHKRAADALRKAAAETRYWAGHREALPAPPAGAGDFTQAARLPFSAGPAGIAMEA
jgi:lysozyme family protein